MNNNDKDSLAIVAYLSSAILVAFLGYIFGKKTPNLLIILAVLILIQQLFVIPLFIKRYRQLYKVKTNLVRFIPIINEVSVLPTFYAITTLVLNILCVISVIVFFAPITFDTYMGIIEFRNINIYFMIITFLLMCLIRGAGYVSVIIDIQKNNEKFTNLGYSPVDFINIISYITVFIPCLRVIGITYQLNVLQKFHIHNFTAFYVNETDYNKLL